MENSDSGSDSDSDSEEIQSVHSTINFPVKNVPPPVYETLRSLLANDNNREPLISSHDLIPENAGVKDGLSFFHRLWENLRGRRAEAPEAETTGTAPAPAPEAVTTGTAPPAVVPIRPVAGPAAILTVLSVVFTSLLVGLKEAVGNPNNPFPDMTLYLLVIGLVIDMLGHLHIFCIKTMATILSLCFCTLTGISIGVILLCLSLQISMKNLSSMNITVIWSGGMVVVATCVGVFFCLVIYKEKLIRPFVAAG